jgi:hypothetical protein
VAKWINRSVVQAPRNGTSSHTIAFTAATAGNLLVLVLEGAVTHTVPTGWTRRNQALNATELSVYTKTATAGESSFSTTHNGADYPVAAVVYEFPAGSSWVNGVSNAAVGQTGNNPTLSGLTGTNLLFAVVDTPNPVGGTAPGGCTWSGVTGLVEDVDIAAAPSASTDGYAVSLAYVEDSTATSFAPLGQFTGTGLNKEALTFAVHVVAPAAPVAPYVASYGPTVIANQVAQSAVVTATAGDLLVMAASSGSDAYTFTITAAGGQTWTKRADPAPDTLGNDSRLVVWTAVAATTGTFTVTVTPSDGAGHNWGLTVQRYTGVSYAGVAASANGGSAPSLAISTTQANSALAVIVSDWNAIDGASRTYRTTAGAFNETYYATSAFFTFYGGYHADAGAAGAKTVGLTAPTGQRPEMVAVELSTAPPPVSTHTAVLTVGGSLLQVGSSVLTGQAS